MSQAGAKLQLVKNNWNVKLVIENFDDLSSVSI